MPEYAAHTDETLLPLLQKGDREAYTEIYNRYHGLLYVFAYNRLKNREEAKDIIHELFLKLWRDRAFLQITGRLSVYLYTAVRNRIINSITHQQIANRYIDSFLSYIEAVDSQSADYLARHNDLQAFIEKEIASLQPRMREVFELSRHTNLSRKEIAEKLGVSEETVKSHMHNALKVLKARLGNLFFLAFLTF
ncbi:RNA polymerase sigma factor [Parapedobacter indicus]|uniref:RNA polymerase sigma-70 factor, ECF subfamily n=1 Tax=Parapedobacter indicus TaxID=1477437 RepID=A0A1I3H2C7_9SPHI|nr:RNA polymerase sigma-70 factor [Parapedobacter indicus]PPL02870.1 RNA polymerase sigma-70 factor (ECF subfamily) [Parapedobacter indicus]SFI29712.1 RNA polymerase sigma-70 factor, ECF subfamily [Parapedobacter indicus]